MPTPGPEGTAATGASRAQRRWQRPRCETSPGASARVNRFESLRADGGTPELEAPRLAGPGGGLRGGPPRGIGSLSPVSGRCPLRPLPAPSGGSCPVALWKPSHVLPGARREVGAGWAGGSDAPGAARPPPSSPAEEAPRQALGKPLLSHLFFFLRGERTPSQRRVPERRPRERSGGPGPSSPPSAAAPRRWQAVTSAVPRPPRSRCPGRVPAGSCPGAQLPRPPAGLPPGRFGRTTVAPPPATRGSRGATGREATSRALSLGARRLPRPLGNPPPPPTRGPGREIGGAAPGGRAFRESPAGAAERALRREPDSSDRAPRPPSAPCAPTGRLPGPFPERPERGAPSP